MNSISRRNKFINVSLVIGSIIFIMLVSEAIFRVYYGDEYGVPCHRDWMFRKNWDKKYENLNSLGHRDHEFTIEKQPNTYRILAVGDSLTYGEGIKQIDDIYTEIITRKLNEGSDTVKYEVLNVGQKGYNVNEYLSFLKDKGFVYKPDLIMIGFYINDIENDKSNRPKTNLMPESLHWILSRVSYLYWYSSYRYDVWKNKKIHLDYYLSYCSPHSQDWKLFKSRWSEMLELCKSKGIETVVVILPLLAMLNDEHPLIPVYQNVEKLSAEHGAKVLKLFSFVKGYEPSDLWIGKTDSHPNEKAHQIYGDQIYNFLKENILITE